MFNGKSVFKLSDNILKRFETSIDDGVMFLFNVDTNEVWSGSFTTKYLINSLDGRKTLDEVYQELFLIFEGVEFNDIVESYNSIVVDLLDKNFIESV